MNPVIHPPANSNGYSRPAHPDPQPLPNSDLYGHPLPDAYFYRHPYPDAYLYRYPHSFPHPYRCPPGQYPNPVCAHQHTCAYQTGDSG